jgi:hypothetical protein
VEVRISGNYKYIPKWRGNDKLPESEQIVVHHTYLTPEQEEKYSTFHPVYKGKEEVELEIKTNAVAIWNTCVQSVAGFTDAESKLPITDPKKIATIPGMFGLITEVVAHIKKGFDEEELKNFG